MPDVIVKINYISPLKWGAWILTNTAFKGETFTCTETIGGQCAISTGEQVIELYGMTVAKGDGGMQFHLWVVAIVTAGYMVLAFVILRIRMSNQG